METSMVIAIIIFVLSLMYILMIRRTAKLNANPRQIELSLHLAAFIESTRESNPFEGWNDVVEFIDDTYPHLGNGEKQTKLVHAISMIKPHISREDYLLLVSYGKRF